MTEILDVRGAGKSFTMHLQGGIRLPVIASLNFTAKAGACVAMAGPSGAGKSSVLKMIYGSYRCDEGEILLRDGDTFVDVAKAEPRRVIALRRTVMGYVSQFLRAVPRVPAIDVVAEPLLESGIDKDAAREKAAAMLSRLNIAERLWALPPATFSGGEQQRVNIARGFLPERPLLLLDEPTASLDQANRAVVVDMIAEKKRKGAAIVAIVHDEDVRDQITDTVVDVTKFAAAA